ncbi:mycofactocin precursor MftA [Streptomyces cinnabarinus]|uniref:Mycofactocin MftA n=1 Tax=Streptomyces cinnabarinus TaxID=67287 RepID=A0ABY7KTT3_9ACTN|nr:mycofactocin precursor MftA [Streptomyces cinnabarinus]WAZ26361.1 mycofactocin precursor MftA [Streptomyces cinnabarinus]
MPENPQHNEDDAEFTDTTVQQDLLVEDVSIDGMCGVY